MKTNEQKLEELTNEGMIDTMSFDYTVMKLNMLAYSANYVWQRFIRSN